jgi:mycofactocin precursor peptide peptidase
VKQDCEVSQRKAHSLSDLPWAAVERPASVLVPLGSTEQHGHHLPLSTDTTIATAVAHAVAGRLSHRPDWGLVLVAPPISYGASGEHQDFPGTISIGDALRVQLIELVRSVSTWAARIVIINAHGGNLRSLAGAVSQLINERHNVSWTPCGTQERDAHAGHFETSLMLHLAPDLVEMSRAQMGNTTPLEQLLPMIIDSGVAHVSRSGVLGDPTSASADQGALFFAAIVEDVATRIEFNRPGPNGCLQRPEGAFVKPSAV